MSILDKMLRIAGRGPDGTAKAITTDADGNLKTTVVGSLTNIKSAPVTGVKTITATAAEVFAGASVKENRSQMFIKNEDVFLRFRIGSSIVSQQSGFPVEPGASVLIEFDPATAVPIYAISEGTSLQVSVWEV
jgi:hypothetical protein